MATRNTVYEISIPAFREEGDICFRASWSLSNPFQSPPSVRKATAGVAAAPPSSWISIPAFREEGDPSLLC